MPVLNIRMSPTLHAAFHKHCDDHGLVASEVVRKLVERVVDGLDDRAEEQRQAARPRQAAEAPRQAQPVRRLTDTKPVGYAMDGSAIYSKAFTPQSAIEGTIAFLTAISMAIDDRDELIDNLRAEIELLEADMD